MRPTLYTPLYQVSEEGKVWSNRKQKFLSPSTNEQGYMRVRLYYDNKTKDCYIHRLVYEAYNGPIPHDKEINHKNSVRSDNSLSNLEAISHKENSQKKIIKGSHGKKPITITNTITNRTTFFPSLTECASFLGVKKQNFLSHIHRMKKNNTNIIRIHQVEYIVYLHR